MPKNNSPYYGYNSLILFLVFTPSLEFSENVETSSITVAWIIFKSSQAENSMVYRKNPSQF